MSQSAPESLTDQRWLVSSIHIPSADYARCLIVQVTPTTPHYGDGVANDELLQIFYTSEDVHMTVNQSLVSWLDLLKWFSGAQNVVLRTLRDFQAGNGFVYQAHFSSGL